MNGPLQKQPEDRRNIEPATLFLIFRTLLIISHRPMIIMRVKYGAIQVLRNADGGGGGVRFSGKKRYEGVMFNVNY